jgi:dTDP-4-dehydrorhamnose 3,5-epimerase
MSEFDPSQYNELSMRETRITGLLDFDVPVHGDSRGWFKENYQREKLVELGLPADFEVVQNNVSYNEKKGVTRGIHAEPWDKFISIAFGSVFAAIVDFRPGDTFGVVETFELNPGRAIFVPRGCGNSFQTLEDHTVYTYLVNEHWSLEAEYTLVNLADPALAIAWPIPLDRAEVSEKDLGHPLLADIKMKAGE